MNTIMNKMRMSTNLRKMKMKKGRKRRRKRRRKEEKEESNQLHLCTLVKGNATDPLTMWRNTFSEMNVCS